MAGYSAKSLAGKLGIKEHTLLYVEDAPSTYLTELGELPAGTEVSERLSGSFDFMHVFAADYERLAARLPLLVSHLAPQGMLWLSWPKGSSKVATSLNGNLVRELGHRNKLIDVKVCAVDEIWSGHKFVRRKERPL